MPEVVEKLDRVSVSELKHDLPKVLRNVERQGKMGISYHNKLEAVFMSVEEYESLKDRILALEETLDRALLFVEIQARKSQADQGITLEQLKEKYHL